MSEPQLTSPLILGEHDLTAAEIVSVARDFRQVTLGEAARRRVELSRAVVEELLAHDVKVYGITTGFASLREQRINSADAGQLSTNLIKSHSTGVGEPFAEDVVRGAMLVRAHMLARGYSGVRVELIQALIDMLNAHVYPFVPQQGSVGSSGDLAPLSHLFLVATGDPEALIYRRDATEIARLYVDSASESDFVALCDLPNNALPFTPITLQAKEGLGANNGAVFSVVVTALATHDAGNLLAVEELVAALSFEALQAVPDCLHPALTQTRPHAGHLQSASNIRAALTGSQLVPPDRPASLNMAHYNRAMMKIHRLARKTPENACSDRLRQLHQLMESAQAGLCDTSDDSKSCAALLEPVLATWREELGWGKTAPAEASSLATFEALSAIYSRHVSAVLRPDGDPDLQDNYSFRATPTVLGAARQALTHASGVVTTEINSVTDNPIILLDEILERYDSNSDDGSLSLSGFQRWLEDNWTTAAAQVKSAANFHGEPIGMAADYLGLAMAEAGNISERRLAALLESDHSKGLPSYLIWEPGLNSGLMLTQYTAASLVSENKTLAAPASVDSIPTGESCEDHNSMSTLAARELAQILGNVKIIVALEALAAYQAVQFRKPMALGKATGEFETIIASAIGSALTRLSAPAVGANPREFLRKIGLGESALSRIHPCIVQDISMRPLLQKFFGLIDSPAVIDLARRL